MYDEYNDIDPQAVLREIVNADKTREYMRAVTGPAHETLRQMGLEKPPRWPARPSVVAALRGFEVAP